MEKHDVNINKQSRPNGTQCRKKLMPFGHPYWYSALAALWAPFGIHRATPERKRLWSALPFGHPLVYWETPLYLCSKQNLGCVLNSNKLLQEKTIYGIYMTGLRSAPRTTFGHPPSLSRSGNFVGTPPQVRDIRGGGAQDRQSVWFCTYGHPEFKFYAALRAASP